jgi:pyridoxamine 5'-phosphate oxidase
MKLSEFVSLAMQNIKRGSVDRKAKFRLPILASSSNNKLTQRIVIVRKFNQDTNSVTIFTDHKSQKVSQIKHNENCHLLFWDSRRNLQVSICCIAKINDKETTDFYWKNLSELQKKDYLVNPSPKTLINSYNNYNYESTKNRFTVIEFFFQQMDILLLDKNGHKRAIHDFKNGLQSWVTP